MHPVALIVIHSCFICKVEMWAKSKRYLKPIHLSTRQRKKKHKVCIIPMHVPQY